VIELSLCNDENMDENTDESKLYSMVEQSSALYVISLLSKHSKVEILKAFMLQKQMNWMRTVMHDTYESGIQNWCLPLNHTIETKHRRLPEFANTSKACRRMGGPFDPALLSQSIGGNVRLYSNQEELYEFTRRLRDA